MHQEFCGIRMNQVRQTFCISEVWDELSKVDSDCTAVVTVSVQEPQERFACVCTQRVSDVPC